MKKFMASFYLIASGVAILACSAGGGGAGSSSSGSDIVRSFSAGATPVSYTATVYGPRSTSGGTITMPTISAQTAFQYFNNGIANAISQGANKIVFPAGNYSIMPEGGNLYHIAINGAVDLTIDLQGSNLIFQGVVRGATQGNVQGVVINSSQRVLLKNFTIDYDVRISSSGTIQSDSTCGSAHKYVLINTGTYSMADTRIQQAKAFNDSTSTLWGLRANEYYSYGVAYGSNAVVSLTGGTSFYPCSATFDTAFPTVGHTVTVRHFMYDGNTFGIYGSSTSDITLSGITVYSSPAMTVYASGFSRGVALENFNLVKNPGDATRLISGAADGVHFNQVGGDIIIENSTISYQGDDGLNIVTPITNGTTVSGNTVTISNGVAGGFTSLAAPGNTFGFYSPSFSLIGADLLVGLSQAASTVLTFASLAGVSSSNWMVDQTLSTSRVYISGNTFSNNRERGMMARSTGTMISNNNFVHNSGPGILLLTDGLSFNEGGFAKDVTISGNTISLSNQTQSTSWTFVLEFGALGIGIECPAGSGCTNTIAPTSLIQNIAITNNTISTSSGIGMLLSNITNASISGNSVTDTSSTVQQSSFGGAASAAGSIHYTRSSGMSFGANTLSRAVTNN